MNREVLFFHPINDYTGSTRVLANIIADKYSSDQVTVITNRNHNLGFLSENPNIRIINYWTPEFKGKYIPVLFTLAWRITSFIVGMLYGWRFKTFYINTVLVYYAAIIGRLYGKKIIFHVHEHFLERSLSVRFLMWVFNHVKAHRIFVSYYTKNQYRDNPNCTWEIQYNKLSKSFVRKINIRPISQRKRDTVLMMAALSKTKGISMFLKVANKMPNIHFCLILSANMSAILQFINDSIPRNVKLLSAQPDVHSFLHDSDLILNLSDPSYGVESFGLTILEAMSYGIPAVVPSIGGPVELVKDGYNGFCVDVTNVDEVVNAILRSLSKDNYNYLSENALLRYKTDFS